MCRSAGFEEPQLKENLPIMGQKARQPPSLPDTSGLKSRHLSRNPPPADEASTGTSPGTEGIRLESPFFRHAVCTEVARTEPNRAGTNVALALDPARLD